MKSQIFSAYYHSETGGVGITFVYTTDIETAEEYLDRIFGESLISVQKYVRPKRKKKSKKRVNKFFTLDGIVYIYLIINQPNKSYDKRTEIQKGD